MLTTLFCHPKLTVRLQTGSEGPKHDPYAFEEITATTPRGTIMIHQGLSEYLEIDGVKLEIPPALKYHDGQEWMYNHWRSFVGFTRDQINRIHRRLKSRCHHCGSREFKYENGYPGEHLEVCCGCGCIHDSYFCISEIE